MTMTKKIIATALTGAFLLPAVSAAQAGPRYDWDNHHKRPPYHDNGRHYHKKKGGFDAGTAAAAGIIGLAAGAIIAGAANQNSYSAPVPAPGTVSPGYQPWSPAWYQYCSSKYRSFNPNTGTYTTYSGVQKFCQ